MIMLAWIPSPKENSVVTPADEQVTKKKHCFEVIVLGRTFLIQAAYGDTFSL